MLDTSVGEDMGKYKLCLRKAYKAAESCISIFEEKCTTSTLKVTKTVRGTMAEVGDLLSANPNFRVIHLIRDPRPVVMSRRTHSSFRSIYSGDIDKGFGGDISKEAHVYCDIVVRDLKQAATLEERYPGRILQVIYEDFVQNPVQYITAIYKYLEQPLSQKLKDWIVHTTHGHMGQPKGMNETQAMGIVNECSELYDLLHCKWPYAEENK